MYPPVNDSPVITGQNPLSSQQKPLQTDEETLLRIQLSDLTVIDSDHTFPEDFTLNILEGENYTVQGDQLTPAPGFTGKLSIPVKVNDSMADSNLFYLDIMVRSIDVPENDPPLITGQHALSTQEESPLLITLEDLTVKDSDNLFPEDFTLIIEQGENYSLSGNTITPESEFTGTLSIPLIVNDGTDNSNRFYLTVTVEAEGDSELPIANAGPNQTVAEASTVFLDGTASSSPNGDIVDYFWEQTGGVSVTLSDDTDPKPFFLTPPVDVNGADLIFSLTVTDAKGEQARD